MHGAAGNVPGHEDPYDPYDDPPGVPEPTYLTTTHMGTVEWQPTWPAETKHDEEDNDVFSSLFSDLNLPIAAMAQTVGLSVDAGRNSVSILENPSASNGYALIVDFNDYEGGADLYTVQLNYTPVPLPPSALLLGSGLLGLLAVRGRCRGHRD